MCRHSRWIAKRLKTRAQITADSSAINPQNQQPEKLAQNTQPNNRNHLT
jgi:hypothetical protein